MSSFSGKYSLEQFSTLLKLEKKGFNSQECERYLSSLAVKIQVDDYADFLEAEKIGLTVEQYAVYTSSLKTKMSAVDYAEFLKAQKIGITLGKYLQYLKSFKDEMSIEEYDTYLKAEDNGMDREHYAEYLEKYKDTYTIERYLEFDKARSLGMTLEEYDLRMEASKYGMSVEKYQAHKDAEKLQMTDEEYEIYKNSGISESIADGVLTIPSKLTELPKNVFKHFEFTSVVFPETLTKIADRAFEDCKQLSSVVIPSRIKKIGDEAFKGCELLEDVTIENGVEEVGDSAFEGCKKLKELYIPGTVKDFENHAVYGCDSLEKLEFEYGVESIDVSEWTELANLKTVITPATASIKLFPTYRKTDTTYRIINSDYKFSINSGAKIDCITPAEYSEYGLDGNKDEIEYLEVRGDYVFLDLSGFAKLKIVDFSAKGSIRSVKNCPSLQMIIYKSYMSGVPSGYVSNDKEREEKIIEMKTLAMNHFDVPSLRFLAVDNGAMVVDLDDYSASDLAWVHVPACTLRLGLNTPSVSAVAVHGNCKISSDTLVGAENISKVRFDKDGRENGVYSNGSARSILSAEFASADLIELRIDRTEFTAETMGVQRHVRHISLPDGLIRIGDNAFEAWGLENITIPASLEKLGNNAFMDCKQLKSVVFEGTPKTVGCDVFDNCSSLESITIGGRILSADEFADQYEIKGAAPVVKPEVTTAFEKMTEEDNAQEDEPIMVVSQQPEVEIENDDSVAVNVAGQFSMRLPSNFVYSTDAAVIGKNRALIAMLDDETVDFGRPYSATESITVLIGKAVASSADADTVAVSIGVKNGNVLQDIPGLNVRYAVKEAGESQSIYLALICTNSNSYPTQIFFNNATDVDAEQIVAGLLKSVEIKAESVAETREEQKESSERVDLVEEKIAPMVDRSVSTDVPAGVLYQPGFEPEKIKVRLDRLFEKLDSAYPDKVIVGLSKNHKHWSETVTELYRLLGYSDNKSFLNAYGYIISTGVSGRPANDPMEVVNELKRRYADGATCTKIAELAAENPDLAPKFKNLGNHADKFFGMTLQKYFVQEGILSGYAGMEYSRIENKRIEDTEKAREEKSAAEMAAPVEKNHYEPQTYYVDEIDISGKKEVSDWEVTNRDSKNNCWNHEGEIYIKDYHGSKDHIILPVSINGKRISGIDSFAFQKSTATVMEIPGAYGSVAENMCFQNKALRTVIIGEGITKICDCVFRGNKELQSVSFPSTLKEIGKRAFEKCGNLTSIELPEGIERLGTACFSGCKKLTKVNIPDSLIEIGKSAFNGCTGLTEVELGESVEIIEKKAFIRCSMLRSFRMNNRVKAILAEAFKKCTALEAIELPDSLTEIGNEAFSECTSLDHVVIPRGVAKINSSAFSNCKSLKSIQMHEGITEIAGSAFENCTGLTEMVLPVIVGQKAFGGCTALEKVTFTPGMTKIDKNALYGCTALTEVTIPEGVEVIDESAFYGCVALKAVTLPSTLKEIGRSAFRGCTSLHSVCIPNAVSTIGDNAFEDCTALAEVVMADGVSNLGVDVFTNTPYMKNAFGEFVVIGGALLKYRGEKENVVIPDNVSAIRENAFAEAYHVESITIPDTVKTIADKVFGNVSTWGDDPRPQLKKLVIGNGVTSIGKQAFYKCEALTDVSFGSSLSTIGQEAFGECKNLKAIDLSKTALTAIDQDVFWGCENAKKLALPETIKTIGRSAFSGNPLGIVKLPKSVKRVEWSAFDGASELIVYDSIDPDAAWAYEWKYDKRYGSVNSLLACAMLYVPQGDLACKINASWRDYHITVLSADTDEIRYRIFCDSKEKDAYRAMMFSAWGKHASFIFDDYDEYFMKTNNQFERTEMAFCRTQYPEGVNAVHRANYEAFLERCLYIERSAKRTAEMIANDDNVERLQLLDGFHAIDEHNIAWIREQMEKKKAVKCIAYLDERYSK